MIVSKESCTNHTQKILFFYVLLLVHPLFAILTETISFLLLFLPQNHFALCFSVITLKDGNKRPPALVPSGSPAEMPLPVPARGSNPAAWVGAGNRMRKLSTLRDGNQLVSGPKSQVLYGSHQNADHAPKKKASSLKCML